MKLYLETKRFFLRPIDKSDGQNLCDLNSDPEVMRYLGQEPDMKSVIPKIIARNEKYNNQLGLFAAIQKETNEFMGWFILRPHRETPEDTKNLEIGYRLKRKFWGHGIATEGTKSLIEKATLEFKARRIYGEAMKANHVSIRVMEKVGLTFEKEVTEAEYWGKDTVIVTYSRLFPHMTFKLTTDSKRL